jgi:hypothetical protein
MKNLRHAKRSGQVKPLPQLQKEKLLQLQKEKLLQLQKERLLQRLKERLLQRLKESLLQLRVKPPQRRLQQQKRPQLLSNLFVSHKDSHYAATFIVTERNVLELVVTEIMYKEYNKDGADWFTDSLIDKCYIKIHLPILLRSLEFI